MSELGTVVQNLEVSFTSLWLAMIMAVPDLDKIVDVNYIFSIVTYQVFQEYDVTPSFTKTSLILGNIWQVTKFNYRQYLQNNPDVWCCIWTFNPWTLDLDLY